MFDARTFEPHAVQIDPARQEWTALTPAVAPELALIKARLPGHDFQVQSQTDDDRRWIVMSYTAEQPATYHLLDRDQGGGKRCHRRRHAGQEYSCRLRGLSG